MSSLLTCCCTMIILDRPIILYVVGNVLEGAAMSRMERDECYSRDSRCWLKCD